MTQIRSLQVLRAVAACVVVVAHAAERQVASWTGDAGLFTPDATRVGFAGVDIFFVLSGFLMAFLHYDQFGKSGASLAFWRRRLIRIVPIYWLLTSFALGMTLLTPHLIDSVRAIEWQWLLGHFIFVPIADSTGSTTKLLVVGWTLDYEMLFYALFAVFMLWRRGLLALVTVMLVAVGAGILISPEHSVIKWLTNLMLLEFLAGVVIAYALRRFAAPAPIAQWIVFVVGITGFFVLPQFTDVRVLNAGIPAALLVTSTLWLGFACKGLAGRSLVVVGDASYSIYLTQVFSLPAIALIGSKTLGSLPADAAVVMLSLGGCAAGLVFWLTVERPLTRWLKAVAAPKRQHVTVVAH